MDKLLVSGNGKGNSAIYLWGFLYLLTAIGGGVLMYYAATQMQSTVRLPFGQIVTTQNPMADYWYYGGLVIAACAIIGIPILAYCILKTRIDVYENYIEGIGVGQYFLFGDLRTKRFKLAYEQITSFDVTSNAIAIHASGTQYNCYVKNASEIQSVIFNQKQALTEK